MEVESWEQKPSWDPAVKPKLQLASSWRIGVDKPAGRDLPDMSSTYQGPASLGFIPQPFQVLRVNTVEDRPWV